MTDPTLRFADYPHHVQRLVNAALHAADPAGAVRNHLQRDGGKAGAPLLTIGNDRYRLDQGRLILIAVGKASLSMGRAALKVIGDDLDAGIFITKKTGQQRVYSTTVGSGDAPVKIYEAGHPLPDESSLEATRAVADLLAGTEPGDLVLCLISGGTSALLTQPVISLEAWQRLVDALLASGCTINELNRVRKQLDRVKGGGLARMAAPAGCVSLILSDVVGNPLDMIGSGPTAPDPDTAAEAMTVLHRYNIANELPPEMWRRISDHLTSPHPRTVDDAHVKNIIVGDIRHAAEAARAEARQMGFDAHLLTAHLEGEAREVGRVAAALAKDARPGQCLLLGGETTVTLRGDGRGGRNQEVALAAALALSGWEHVVLASIASDGEDGPTDAAGAMITGRVAPQAHTLGLLPRDALDRNDSYTFFQDLKEKGGDTCLIRTGPTGTNVNDLLLILTYPAPAGA